MEVRTMIAKQVGKEHYVAILHWPGGVRWEEFKNVEECKEWHKKEIEGLLDNWEIILDEESEVRRWIGDTSG